MDAGHAMGYADRALRALTVAALCYTSYRYLSAARPGTGPWQRLLLAAALGVVAVTLVKL